MRRPRRRTVALSTLAVSFVIASQTAMARGQAEPDPTSPTGIGDLLPAPIPASAVGDNPTLFEKYSPTSYTFDWDSSWRSPLESVFNGLSEMIFGWLTAIVRGAIAVSYWLFSFTKVEPISEATSNIIGSAGQTLMAWLFPSAIAFGAVVAYMQRRTQGSAMSQIFWVFAAGLISISFAVSPTMWVNGIDGARQVGADMVMSTTSGLVGGDTQSPITIDEKPAWKGTAKDDLLRKSADATWRGFAVTPWCIAEFGSIEACQRYGKGILDRGSDMEARKKYIDNEMEAAEGKDDAPTMQWTKGKNPFGRLAVVTLALIPAVIFAFLSVALALTALMAYVGCLMLLVVGVVFACLWVIPGKPRQWGMNWFEALLGMMIQAILAMLVFGTALSLVTAIYSLSSTMGWLPMIGLAIVVLVAAFQLRRVLNGLVTLMRPGSNSLMVGRGFRSIARMMVSSTAARLSGSRGLGYAAGQAVPDAEGAPMFDRRGRRRMSGEGHRTSRQYRTAPAPMAPSGGPPGDQFTSGRSGPPRRPDPSGTKRALPGGRYMTAEIVTERPQRREAAAQARNGSGPTREGGSSSGAGASRRRTFTVSAGGVVVPSDGRGSSNGRSARARPAAQPTRTVRRQGPVRAPDGRYEPRRHYSSASLRDGPPKPSSARDRRRAAPRSRQYREYSKVVKDGVTLYVPNRG